MRGGAPFVRMGCRPEDAGEASPPGGLVTFGHETWPPQISAHAVSLRLQQQIKSILSPRRCRAPFQLGARGRFRYGLRSVNKGACCFLTPRGRETSNETTLFDRTLAFLTHARSRRFRIGGPTMGFVAKSAFWLGLVYSAMPFDSERPTALAAMASAISPVAGPSLASLAGEAILASRSNQNDWKADVQAATALCSQNCLGAPPTGFSAGAAANPAEPPRRVSRAKSGRESAVRPPNANHIRSPDRQT
jgi:hypothetical protein